jgi:hypothetical protein
LGRTLKLLITGMDVPNSIKGYGQDVVFVSSWNYIGMSTDAGRTFQQLGLSGLPTGVPLQRLTVSPANTTEMSVWYEGEDYNWEFFYSHDQGQSWQQPTWDNRLAFMPYNVRPGLWAYHPTNSSIVSPSACCQ